MKQKLIKASVVGYLGLVVVAVSMTVTTTFAALPLTGDGAAIVEAIKNFNNDFKDYTKTVLTISGNYTEFLKEQVNLSQTGSSLKKPIQDENNANITKLLTNSVLYVPNAKAASENIANLMPTSTKEAEKKAPFFNASNYLNTYVLTNQSIDPTNFISTLASAGNPIQTLPASAYKNAATNPAVATFLAGMASYSARESVGIGSLGQLIYERMPVNGLSIDGKPASALSYDAKLATQRMDASWYNQILSNKDTSPTDLMRENTLIAAESRYELFQIRMQLEQLNATMATLQLAYEENTSKPLILAARNEAVSTSIQ